jgi:hypothetical protein
MNIRTGILAFILMVPASTPRIGAQTPVVRTGEDVGRELDEVGRIATVLLDGDLCRKILTRRALDRIFLIDPKDPWVAGDNFDVNHENFIATKKILIRLSRLVPYPCDVNLWMPFPEKPDKIQILIRNANEWSQFWTWGKLTQDMPVEMKSVLQSGKREKVMGRSGMVSVLAPVYDSLGEIAGLVEVIAAEPGARLPQVHAKLKDGNRGGASGDSGQVIPAR